MSREPWHNPDRPCLCGANVGDPCEDQCPAATAAELEVEQHYDPPCCPDPQYAARVLCGCWGSGSGGQWIGSAA